jgi:hypothetical protein
MRMGLGVRPGKLSEVYNLLINKHLTAKIVEYRGNCRDI